MTDLSLGGCYVETESPFPERSAIVLSLMAGDMEVHAEGVVRSASRSRDGALNLRPAPKSSGSKVGSFIDFLSNSPGTTPKLLVMPRALLAGYDAAEDCNAEDSGDALLELLRSHESMSQE